VDLGTFKVSQTSIDQVAASYPHLWTKIILLDAPEVKVDQFEKYLLSALDTDYTTHTEWCDQVLAEIDQLERGEITTYAWDGQGFQHRMTASKVIFEHTIFGECPDWPLWSCTLAQYKAALQGWRKFIEMPKSIDTQLIIELPDDAL
jgi:hypothetical protein